MLDAHEIVASSDMFQRDGQDEFWLLLVLEERDEKPLWHDCKLDMLPR